MSGKRVVILGAGFSGLTVGNRLHELGFDVQLFERQERWGGLAQTFRRNGFQYDFGPHYITNRLATTLGIMDQCVHVPYAESIYTRGRFYAFPFGLMRRPLFAVQAGLGMLSSQRARKSCTTAAEYFQTCYGRALTDEILGPLVTKWSGVPPEELSVDFVDRVPPPSLGVLLRKVLGIVTRKSIQTMPGQGLVYHVIPRPGIQLLSDTLAEPIKDRVHLGTSVERVRIENARVVGVDAGGESIECDAVVSTLPAPVLPDLIEGSRRLDSLKALRFRPIVLGFLEVRRPRVLDRLLTWFPDPRHVFYRLSEQKIADPGCAPEGRTLLTVEMACSREDEVWGLDERELRARLVEQIGDVYGIPEAEFGGLSSLRTPFGYPMYDVRNDTVRRSLGDVEGELDGMFLVGRTGSFRYILLEESHRRALAATESVSQWARAFGGPGIRGLGIRGSGARDRSNPR